MTATAVRKVQRLRRVLIAGDLLVGLAIAAALFGRAITAVVLLGLAWGCAGLILSNVIRDLQERP